MSPREIFAELVRMRDTAGKNLYRRLKLVDQLLSDRGWVEDPTGGGGDASRAIDRLEEHCFGDLCGALSLPQLLELLECVPQESIWKQKKFHLRRMFEEMKARKDAEKQVNQRVRDARLNPPPSGVGGNGRSIPVPPIPGKSLEEVNKELKAQLKQKDQEISQLRHENKRLRRAVKKLQEAVREFQAV